MSSDVTEQALHTGPENGEKKQDILKSTNIYLFVYQINFSYFILINWENSDTVIISLKYLKAWFTHLRTNKVQTLFKLYWKTV